MPAAIDALVVQAGRANADLAALRQPVETLHRVFPDSVQALESKLAPVLIGTLVRLASASGTTVAQLAEPLRTFRALFGGQTEEMERRVGADALAMIDATALAEGLLGDAIYANPDAGHHGEGYGRIRFDKAAGQVTFECWPRHVDVSDPAPEQFPGWPITVPIRTR